MLVFCLISISLFPQEREKVAAFGTVTITESGQVIVQPFTGPITKPENGVTSKSRLPQKFIDQKAVVKPTVKTEISLTDPESSEKLIPNNNLGTRIISSTGRDVQRVKDSGPSEQLPDAVYSALYAADVKAQAFNQQNLYERNVKMPLTTAPYELLSLNNITLVRWYGEKEYFIPPTTSNPREYQQRINAYNNQQKKYNNETFHILDVNITPVTKELLKSIDIIVPEFMAGQVKICIPESDFQFLEGHHIDYTLNESYGASLASSNAILSGIKSANEKASTIWSEGFEGTFPGTSYNTGDSQSLNGVDTWDDVSCDKYSGSWSIWCADNGDQLDCVNYDDNMSSWVKNVNAVNVSGYTDNHFNFYTKYVTETTNDLLKYWASSNGTSWSLIASYSGTSGGWVYKTFLLTGYTTFYWEFDFISNTSVHNTIGAYLDDLSVTGTVIAPNLTYQSGSGSCTVSGTSINLGYTVVNNGTASAVASEAGYYLSPDINITTTPNYLIGTDAVSTLAIGATSAETFTADVAAMSIPCGTYYIFFCIDHLDQVAESNENDNDWYFSSPQVTIPCLPNLDFASGTGSLSVTGTSIDLAVTVINNGSDNAGASVLGYYLSPDYSITTTPNYLIGSDAVATLAVGATSAETFTADVAAMSVPCGTYYIFFCIDHLDQIAESNEYDNDWYFTSPQVTIPCVPNLDLASGTASLSVTGTTIDMAVTVINNGSDTAGASVLGYYLSPDNNITTTPNYVIGSDAVPTLAVGATSAETFTADVAAMSIPCGSYYIFFCIDNLGQIVESNEYDNDWYFTSPQVAIPCVPNLDLASGTGNLIVNETSISVDFSLINNGSTNTGTSEVGFYLSQDALFSTEPNYLFWTAAIPALGIGATCAVSITEVDVAAMSIPNGTYYVFFFIDHLKQVAESNENDNIWYFSTPQVTVPEITGFADVDISEGPILYPNPANELINIDLHNSSLTGRADVKIYDNLGQLVINRQVFLPKFSLEIKGLENGVYVLNIYNEGLNKTVRFVKE